MHDLPRVQKFEFDDPAEGQVLEFRLTYKGPLPADQGTGNKAKYKHLIRKHFHKQLRELWKQHPSLRLQAESSWQKLLRNDDGSWQVRKVNVLLGSPFSPDDSIKGWIEHIADDHQSCNTKWVPLVSKVSGFSCSLEILFMRRDGPGGLVAHGGDIDNRIKTLLDGLRKPDTVSDLGGLPIDPDENPFHCLLQDDRLITGITVTTDRLLVPLEAQEKDSWVELVIGVKITNPNALFENNRLV